MAEHPSHPEEEHSQSPHPDRDPDAAIRPVRHTVRRVVPHSLSLYVPRLLPMSALPKNVRHVVATFGIAGWIGFWSQVVLAGIAALTLLLAIPGRTVGSEVNVSGSGVSVVLTVIGLVWLGVSLYLGFRYTRVPWRLRAVDPQLRPTVHDTVNVLRWGMWVDMAGAIVALVGVEMSVFVLLAKALSQPQGVAIYDPLRIIRPLDVLMVLANVNVLAGFVVGLLVSLWLLNDLHRT
ncbi:MAG: hypothetical protein OHK0012_05540 [Synechococcales cyanobacterium]